MVIVPNSDIILLKSPLKLDNYNQITFPNKTTQYNYFSSLPKLEYDDCTYQRKDGVIRYATNSVLTFEDLLQYNYCMYRNTSYDSKWFYAFVTDVTYINDGMTEVKIETDPFQTWQFDISYKNSFIEREHVSDDTVGLHTVPEDLETGDYIINSGGDLIDFTETYTCIGVTWIPNDTPGYSGAGAKAYGRVFSGLYYLLFKSLDSATRFITQLDQAGREAGATIQTIFEIPRTLSGVSYTDEDWFTANFVSGAHQFEAHMLPSVTVRTLLETFTITRPTTIDGYTPKNNKLFVAPYNTLLISNKVGMQSEYKYEDFLNNTPTFKIVGTITPGNSIYVFPKNYKLNGTTNIGYNWGIPVGKFPQGSWNSDPYTNWLTQNGVNILGHKIEAPKAQAIAGSIQALVGAVTGSGDGIATGLGGMFGSVQEQYRHSLIPDTVNGQINSGDITYAYTKLNPSYYKMTIKSEYARIIDNWFSMYGYKVNRLATPNIHKRSNWDYMKCIDVNLEGDIPEADLSSIRSLFNNGCTFWHTTTYYLDYSKTNSIL